MNKKITEFLMLVIFTVLPFPSLSAVQLNSKLPAPVIDRTSWVMIEIWPQVNDITLAAYFLDYSYKKNKNLCAATKSVFDREAKAGQTSYRVCMSVSDAIAQGYIEDDKNTLH